MALTPGTRLGPYEILSALGAGGMGEVYRARDTKLNREVALKVLPDAFTRDPDRLARFTREAQMLASLNHPHIGAIYGFEDASETHALVLELIEGDTLADRIARGAIPLDEALAIARQIGDALEAAHEHGIVHRDLKPSNIKITPDGVVKVLDFGLAKLVQPQAAASRADVTASPTITSPAMVTGMGVILGTAAYMSPEQAKGREADKRSDVWAFGCVVYEMLSGRRAFDGEDMTDVLGAVVRLEPNWEALPANLPQTVRTLLQRCLVKDRRKDRRHRRSAFRTRSPDGRRGQRHLVASVAAAQTALAALGMVLIAGALMVAALGAALMWFAMRPLSPRIVRTTITTSGSTALALDGTDRDVAITPDGSSVVYRGNNNQILVRALNQLETTVLSVGPGPGPRGLFISPDGQWVGFFNGNAIKRVAITGGPPMLVCAGQGALRGATWGPDGTIIFATATGLQRVSEAGGEPAVLTKSDRERGEGDHRWPEFLPGGEAVLFTITPANGSVDNSQVAVLDLQTGTSKVLISGSHAHYVPTGHLVYGVTGTLRAVAFDLRRLKVVGTAAPVLEGVLTTAFGAADVAVAANGSLVYVPGVAGGGGRRTVVSVDWEGNDSPLPGLPPDVYRDVRVSPDGAQLALATQTDIWTYDFARAARSKLTTHPASDTLPLWTPDSKRIIFTSNRAGYPELYWRSADGSGSDQRLLTRAKDLLDLRSNGWSADGRQLLFTEVPSSNQSSIWQIEIEHPSDAKVLLKSEFNNDFAAVSPNGRSIAYRSTVSGRPEIYIERYPEFGNRQPISTGGGRLPVWSRDGRELFFGSLDGQMFAVAVQSGPTLVPGRPQLLFDFAMGLLPAQGGRAYDIAPDGRFLIIRSAQAEAGGGTPANLIFVQNWFEELKRLVPRN